MILDYRNVYLLLGSNLGDRHKLIDDAIRLINIRIGEVFATSSLYETDAWGKTDQPSFLNVAVGLKTILQPLEVLELALQIEETLGRVRLEKWGSRLIDIDLIFYDDQVINIENKLQVPHPQMQNRKFVLGPLVEIAPNFIHPAFKKPVSVMFQELDDRLQITKINSTF